MKNLKPIYFWLLLTISLTTLVFTSCEKDEDEPETTTNNTQINSDGITGTLTDIDGNTYAIIKIGAQWWMVENLKVTKYNNGTIIPEITDTTAWGNDSIGACCNYNNDINNVKYGKLYNWYAVKSGKLAPTGWHIPTKTEWTTLENYLIANGYNYDGTTIDNKIAKSLADSTDWNTSTTTVGDIGNNLNINNNSGFSALPGGYRTINGSFDYLGDYGYWWSSSESDLITGYFRSLYYDNNFLFENHYFKKGGLSVRCVKD